MQIAEIFKLIKEILTEQLVPRQTASSSMTLIILLGAKRITIINVVHIFKKCCLAAFSLRNLIVLIKFRMRTVSRFSVFLGWSQYHGLWKKFSKVSYEC